MFSNSRKESCIIFETQSLVFYVSAKNKFDPEFHGRDERRGYEQLYIYSTDFLLNEQGVVD